MLSLVLALLLSTADLTVIDVPSSGSVEVTFGPAGKAELRRDGTVSRMKIEIDRIALPGSFGQALNTFVVWAVSPEGIYENAGSLAIAGGKGRLEATTLFEEFGILITAEPHYMVDRPNSAVAFQNQDPPRGNVRKKTVSMEIGAFDYSKIDLRPQGAVPGLVVQARTAFLIAAAVEAERLAESEFRQARIAADTMEEVLKRSVPLDILEQSANESIRRSQQAVVKARESAALGILEAVRNDLAARDREVLQLQSTIQQLSGRQRDLDAEVRRTQSDLTSSQRQSQNLARELEAVKARLESAERNLTELQRK